MTQFTHPFYPPFSSPLLTQLAKRLAQLPPISQLASQPAAVLVAITDEIEPKILYTLRAADMHHHAGEVSFAGGKRDAGDSDNVATALRETWEETGIPPNLVQVIGALPVQYARSGIGVQPIVGIIPADVTIVPEVGEIARVFWGDLATLIDQPTAEYHLNYPATSPKHRIISPSLLVDGETVWGLTGRITASLLEVGFDRHIPWTYQAVAL